MKSLIIFLLAGLTLAVSVDMARAQSSPAELRLITTDTRNKEFL